MIETKDKNETRDLTRAEVVEAQRRMVIGVLSIVVGITLLLLIIATM